MDNHERQLLEKALETLHLLLGYADAKSDFKPILHVIEGGKFSPTSGKTEKETPNAGTSGEAKQGFVEFTEQEIKQMPAFFRKLIVIHKKRCRVRIRQCGKNTTNYEIRYRAEGYNISASGKTIELAKANFIKKLKTAKPKNEEEYTIPTTFHSFTMYYFETFRKEKVTSQTYRIDLSRYDNNVKTFFGEKPLAKITPLDCKNLLQKLKNAGKGKTADEVYSLLSVIFRCAINHGVLQRSPLVMVAHTHHQRENGTALTKEEETVLLDFLSDSVYLLPAVLMLYCGLRPNELQTAIIDGDFIKAVNSKRKSRTVEYKRIPIIDRLRPFLPGDGIIKIPTLDILRRRIRAALPKHKLYDLRTTFYSRCKECGVSEHALKHFVGHSLGALGNAYTDLSDEYLLLEGKKLNQW